jgi:hypothetical protein
MGVGFEVITDAGSILLDATYPNLALIAQGTVNVGTNTAAGGVFGTIAVPATGQPMVFVRSAGFVAILNVDNGTFSYQLAQGVTTFDYWVFGPPQSIATNYGMQVFDAAGRLCFDAAQKYMRVNGAIAMNQQGMTFNDTGGVGSLLSYALMGSTPAICLADPGYQFQILTGSPVSGGTQYRTIGRCGARINGGSLEIAYFQSRNDLSLPAGVTVNTRSAVSPQMAIIADVTNLTM